MVIEIRWVVLGAEGRGNKLQRGNIRKLSRVVEILHIHD